MPSVLVTGGAGFIGSHVADAFLAAGYTVTILDDLSSGSRQHLPPAAAFVEADIRSAAARTLVRTGRFDVIAHLAAQIDVRKSVADPGFDADVNIHGTLNLLEGAREAVADGADAPRFLFSSTGGALYGDTPVIPSPEGTPAIPEAPYGIAKLSVEHYLGAYAALHGIPSLALRYGNVYGPRQSPHGEAGVVAIFAAKILRQQPVTIFGDGQQTRDYVFVGDVARANLLAAAAPLPASIAPAARAINIGTGQETTVLAIADGLARAAGLPLTTEFAPARAGELARSALAIDRASTHLGWQPAVSLEAGLAQVIAFVRAQDGSARVTAPLPSDGPRPGRCCGGPASDVEGHRHGGCSGASSSNRTARGGCGCSHA